MRPNLNLRDEMSKIGLVHFLPGLESFNRSLFVMDRQSSLHWRRRGFLGGALVAAGAAAGWLVRRFNGPEAQFRKSTTAPDGRFLYDVSEYETTDPALLLYTAADEFPTRFKTAKRLVDWPGRGIVVAGDQSLRLFAPDGSVLQQWTLDSTPHCLCVQGRDELLVGYADRFVVFDANGKQRFASPSFGKRTYLTSLAVHNDRLFAADAGNREVIILERESGEVIGRFGKKDTALGNPGFNVPSPYFALAVAPDETLRIVNPGMLRVETYTLAGRFVSSWGEPGMKIDRFCGCCNPVYFSMTSTGDFITSEKGLARINIYAADGSFQGAVAGPETLVTDKALAKAACNDCTVGAGFDVTSTEGGDVLALDPYRMVVRRFKPKSQS